MSCDLCGASGSTSLVKIEGVAYRACSDCARYGEEIREVRVKKPVSRPQKDEGLVVRPDVARVLRAARERSGKKQDVFANDLRVKYSDYHHWEAGHRVPTIEAARRLEQELGVSLLSREERVSRPSPGLSSENAGLTIGDLFKK